MQWQDIHKTVSKTKQRQKRQLKAQNVAKIAPDTQSEDPKITEQKLDQQSFQLALEEYKIIQLKLDKIGDFCHKVKGWSLTITAGALAGTATTKVPYWFGLGAFFTTWLFKMGDDYQGSLRSVLAARAMEIERYFHDMEKGRRTSKRPYLPFLANAITDKWKEQRRSKFAFWPSEFSIDGFKYMLRHNHEFWAWRSDPLFYYGQLVFILVATLIFGKFGRLTPSTLEATATSTLSNFTNSAFWRGEMLTNEILVSNPPSVLNTIIFTNKIETNIINVSVPVFVTSSNIGISTSKPGLDSPKEKGP